MEKSNMRSTDATDGIDDITNSSMSESTDSNETDSSNPVANPVASKVVDTSLYLTPVFKVESKRSAVIPSTRIDQTGLASNSKTQRMKCEHCNNSYWPSQIGDHMFKKHGKSS